MKLEIIDLKKSFGELEVLKGINLSVSSGKALGLLGRNGAGKTTTIRIIMDVFKSDGGQILLDGEPISFKDLKFGYLPEQRGLYEKRKVGEQLIYLGKLKGMKASAAKKATKRLLERLEISDYYDKKLSTLSKGNQQKIQLAVTLINSPDIIILDEPFTGLDPVNSSMLRDLISECIHDGKIVMFSSHQMGYVEEFCDEIAIMTNGEIIISGNIKEIKRGYDRKVIVVSPESDIDAAQQFINSLHSIVVSTDQKDNQLYVTLKDESLRSELIAALASSDVHIEGINVYEPTLGDIFVEYTKEAI